MDIYCGSGTIGLTMSSVVREGKTNTLERDFHRTDMFIFFFLLSVAVVGIEIVEEAVRDARLNAQANDIKNAAFFAGKAEELLREKLRDWSGRSPNFVGIVDPPRNGLHLEAIRNIRGCAKLRRLVYVSCNQQSLINNAGQ
jgi:tRNA/tmRNA/rRNA uracil-C5-methylase (TrmA/RlmC/RlmD family)